MVETDVASDASAVPSGWRNRIIGSGMEAPEQLLANPSNWRTHPVIQRRALRGSLSEVGWVQQVIVNTVTGFVVDGHARIEEAISRGETAVPVLYVELTPDEERLVLATLDPIGALASSDGARLQELLADVTVDEDGLSALLARLRADADSSYTGKIHTPVYEVHGETPDVPLLYDETRADELRREVLSDTELDPAVRDFLLAAAARHTVFDYGQIAEFYAAQPARVQRLMEASALVILDVDDAIANGFVRLMSTVEALEAEDKGA
jgi:hypothetical protein